jgi:hypothetical protein
MALCWNIDAFVDIISVLFPKDFQAKLKEGGRVFAPNNEKFFYVPGRMLAITYASKEVSFYSLHRYRDTEITEVQELAKFGQEVLNAYGEMGIKPTKLSSPVACYDLSSVPYPRSCDLPDSAMDLVNATYKTMSREWRDVYKLGHWNADEVTDLDIQSSYPSLMAQLPDISKAKFFTTSELPKNGEFSWGEMQGKLTITADISPFVHESDNGDCFGKGTWVDSITTDQLWLLRRWGIGTFEMQRGDFFKLPERFAMPFKPTMESLYKARDIDNPITQIIAKATAVGIGGKLQQRFEDNGRSKLGTDFNSIYARMITSRCMVKVADFIYRKAITPISVLVDGVLAQGQVEVPSVKQMGAWRKSPPSNYLVASLLYQWSNTKKPDGRYYDVVMKDIKAHPRSSVYGNVDLNLLEHSRVFTHQPKNGEQLLNVRYTSQPLALEKRPREMWATNVIGHSPPLCCIETPR